MKKIILFSLITIIGISSVFLSSCNTVQDELEKSTKNDIYNYYESLKEKMEKSGDESEFADEILKFVKEKGFDAKKVKGDSVVIELKATEGYEDKQTQIFLVEFSKVNFEKCCQNLAGVIAFANNSKFHGPIRIIMAPKVSGVSTGLQKLSNKYLEGDSLINFTYNEENVSMIYGSAKTKKYTIAKKVDKTVPVGTMAYKINISGLRSGDSGDRSTKHQNPIVFLANFLLNAKSSGLNIEIADFVSSGDIANYPTWAEVTVVVDKSSQAKWEGKLETLSENFKSKNRDEDPDAKLNFSEVAVPGKVLNYESTAQLLGLLYTMEDGLFATTEADYEGDPLGISTITSINTTAGVTLEVMGRVIDEATEANMDNTFATTANLSDFGIAAVQRYPLWKPDEANKFLKDGNLEESLKNKGLTVSEEYTFMENPCAVIQSKGVYMDMITLGFNINEGTDFVMGILEYEQRLSQN